MKNQKGITLISVIVTIIILIILAGVSINATLGENGIITIAKKSKENMQLAQIEEQTKLNEMYTQIELENESLGDISYDAVAKLTEFKKAIANYIEEAGGVKPDYASDEASFGESIKGILKEVTKDATATAQDITQGKTAYVNGELIEGKGVNVSQDELNATLLWTNPSPNSAFATTTLKIDLSEYECVLIISKNHATLGDLANRTVTMCKNPSNRPYMISATGTGDTRSVSITNSQIYITKNTINTDNNYCIPLYIFGLKTTLGIEDYITQNEN